MNQIQRTQHQLDDSEARELTQMESIIERGLRVFWEVGEALFAIRDKRLYRATHATFDAYCRDRWEMSKNQANRLIGAADVAKDLTPMGVIPSSERVARPLVSLPTEQRQNAWQQAVESAPGGKPTAADVSRVVKGIGRHPSVAQETAALGESLGLPSRGDSVLPESGRIDELRHSSQADVDDRFGAATGDAISASKNRKSHEPFTSHATDEHYTPKEIVDAVLECFQGRIELDPCSNSRVSPNVPAIKHFTKDDNGLEQKWISQTVYVNPPYSQVKLWVQKGIQEHSNGLADEIILLVKVDTSTKWFKLIWEHAPVVCFVDHRLCFLNESNQGNGATFPSAVAYLGLDVERFYHAFEGKVGVVVNRFAKEPL